MSHQSSPASNSDQDWLFILLSTKETDVLLHDGQVKEAQTSEGKSREKYFLFLFLFCFCDCYCSHNIVRYTLERAARVILFKRNEYIFFYVQIVYLAIFFCIFVLIFRKYNLNCCHCFNNEASHLSAEFDFIASLYIFPYKEHELVYLSVISAI